MSATINRRSNARNTARNAGLNIDIRDRALHLVDLENLARGPGQDLAIYREAWDDYTFSAGINEQDHIVVATCGLVMADVAFIVPQRYQLRCGNGENAADNILIELFTAEFIACTYEWLVIGSGDHAFVPLALEVQSLGVNIRVVSASGTRASDYSGHGFAVRDLVSRPKGSDLGLIA